MASVEPLLDQKKQRATCTGLELRKSSNTWTPDQEAAPTKEELDEELASGRMTKEEFVAFVQDPKHQFFAILLVITLVVLGNFMFFETMDKPLHVSYLTFIAAVSTLGTLGGTYNTFLLEQMKEQVDKFRALNKRLERNLGRLEEDINGLKDTCDNMHSELEGFKKLKEQMQAYASEQGEGFKDVYEKVSGIYDGMKEAVHEQQRQLLMQTAQNLEFALDGEEGMNEDEFNKFCERLPSHIKHHYVEAQGKDKTDQNATRAVFAAVYERLKNATGIIDIEHVNSFIDDLLKAADATDPSKALSQSVPA